MFSCVKTKTNSDFAKIFAEQSNHSSFPVYLMNDLNMCQWNLEYFLVLTKEKARSNQASISINSCTELSKTQLFPVINLKEN